MRETIAVGVILPFGSLDDTIKGIGHFVEHLLFNSKVAKDFLKMFDEKGILYNGVTSYDYMLIYCQGLRKDRQLMVKFCESILYDFYITNEEFEKEMKVILSEIEHYSNNRIEKISNILMGNHASFAILGSKESVASITMRDIVNYISEITGTFSIVDSDGEIVNKINSVRKKFDYKKKSKNIIKLVTNKDSTFNSYYGIGINTSKEISEYFKVFIDIFSGYLNKEFREKKGCTYRIHKSSVQTNTMVQYQFIFATSVKEMAYSEVVRCTVEGLKRAKKDILNLRKDELEKYLERLETQSNIRLDNRLGMMKYNALKSIYPQRDVRNKERYLKEDIENIDLTIAFYNADRNDVLRDCREFYVELVSDE